MPSRERPIFESHVKEMLSAIGELGRQAESVREELGEGTIYLGGFQTAKMSLQKLRLFLFEVSRAHRTES